MKILVKTSDRGRPNVRLSEAGDLVPDGLLGGDHPSEESDPTHVRSSEMQRGNGAGAKDHR